MFNFAQLYFFNIKENDIDKFSVLFSDKASETDSIFKARSVLSFIHMIKRIEQRISSLSD